MRIFVIGKWPPIQGGVSRQTMQIVEGLAEVGHEMHVVSNALEAQSPQRMFLDEGVPVYEAPSGEGAGSIAVHFTDPVDLRQRHVPQGDAFATKLAGIAIKLGEHLHPDMILSFYLEPYAVAGHVAASALDVPHVVKTAGSDIGRLAQHPQFAPVYCEIFRKADAVVTGRGNFDFLGAWDIDGARLVANPGVLVRDDLFTPDGPVLDWETLARRASTVPDFADTVWGGLRPVPDVPLIGIYGKLGETKGSFALLDALADLRGRGTDVGLLVLGHGSAAIDRAFRDRCMELGLEPFVRQLPFVPPGDVPGFLRACNAICCLEQDFPIGLHRPVMAREVLATGRCLVASTEMLEKLPEPERLAHGYNCLAVCDIHDAKALAEAIEQALTPEAPRIGAKGREYVRTVQSGIDPGGFWERLLGEVVARRMPVSASAVLPAAAPAETGLGWEAALEGDESARRLEAILTASPRTEEHPDPDFFRFDGAVPELSEYMIGEHVPEIASGWETHFFAGDVNALLVSRQEGAAPPAINGEETVLFYRPAGPVNRVRIVAGGISAAGLVRFIGRGRTISMYLEASDAPIEAFAAVCALFDAGVLSLREPGAVSHIAG